LTALKLCLQNSEFDKIIIVMLGYGEVVEQLIKLGIDRGKIEIADVTVSEARANWLNKRSQSKHTA
jgi:hypothetical protein